MRRHEHADRPTHSIEEKWGVDACGLCGSTIALGDRSYRARVAGREAHVCSECVLTVTPEAARLRRVRRSRKDLERAA